MTTTTRSRSESVVLHPAQESLDYVIDTLDYLDHVHLDFRAHAQRTKAQPRTARDAVCSKPTERCAKRASTEALAEAAQLTTDAMRMLSCSRSR
jgi:hypothetical protein